MTTPRMAARRGWLILATLTVAAALTVGGCQTVQGFGKDITSVGEAGEDVINSI